MSNWREIKLGEVVDIISGYAFKSKDFKEDDGIPVIKIGNISFYNVDIYKNMSYVDKQFLKILNKKYIVRNGDILISLTGSHINQPNSIVGRVGKYREDTLAVLNQRAGKIIPKENVCKEYIYQLFSLKSMTYLVATVAYGGANQVNISPKNIENFRIRLPDLQTQERIADVLSTYDDLIENNSKRIEILEKTAEEIYKEWFVRMRFTGYEDAKFEKRIPKGWEVVELSKIIDVADGTHDTPKKVGSGVPLVTGKNIVNESIDFDSTYNISMADFEKINIRSAIYRNDILYSNIGTIGLMVLVDEDNKYSVKNLIILKTGQLEFYEYIYLLFNSKSSKDFFESVASGASQKFISLAEMRKYKILLPSSDILVKFKSYANNLFKEVRMLKAQNQNLTKQRDLLLPRLMNGTIEVK